MPERQPMTQIIKASEVRQNFSQLLNQVYRGERRVLVEKSGIPVAGIVSAADLERLTAMEEQREKRFAVIDEIRAAFKDVPDDELEGEVNRAVNSARQQVSEERRAASEQ